MHNQALSPLRRRELAQDRRQLRAPQQVNGFDPSWLHETTERGEKRRRDLVLYAAALGQKRGDLPLDLREWQAIPFRDADESAGRVEFLPPNNLNRARVIVSVRFLNWKPDAPIEGVEPNTPARELAIRALWTEHPLCELYAAVHGDWTGDGASYQPATSWSVKQLIAFAETLPPQLIAALVQVRP